MFCFFKFWKNKQVFLKFPAVWAEPGPCPQQGVRALPGPGLAPAPSLSSLRGPRLWWEHLQALGLPPWLGDVTVLKTDGRGRTRWVGTQGRPWAGGVIRDLCNFTAWQVSPSEGPRRCLEPGGLPGSGSSMRLCLCTSVLCWSRAVCDEPQINVFW